MYLIVLSPVEYFGLLLVELHEISVGAFLYLVKIPLAMNRETESDAAVPTSSKSFWVCITNKPAECTLCPITQNINEDVKQDRTQH